jgi:hypothetical protein
MEDIRSEVLYSLTGSDPNLYRMFLCRFELDERLELYRRAYSSKDSNVGHLLADYCFLYVL